MTEASGMPYWWDYPMVGPRLQPTAEPTNECEHHRKAARCFHRGELWIAEYRFKNGKWRLDVKSKHGHSCFQQQRLPTEEYADRAFNRYIELLRSQ